MQKPINHNIKVLYYIFKTKNINIQFISDNWHVLKPFLIWNKLIPQFYNTLVETNNFELLSNSLQSEIKNLIKQGTIKSLQIEAVLKHFIQLFSTNHVNFILLKGSDLAYTVYPKPSYRQMIDIDILIYSSQIQNVLELLKVQGCTTLYPIESEHTMGQWHQLPTFIYKNVAIEIHKSLFASYTNDTIQVPDLFNNALNINILNTNCKVLNPTFNIYYLCKHVAKHIETEFLRVNWLLDIHLYYKHYKNIINSDLFFELIKKSGCETEIVNILSITASLFNCNFKNIEKANQNTIELFINKCNLPNNREQTISTFNILKTINSPAGKLKYIKGKVFPTNQYLRHIYKSNGMAAYFKLYAYYFKKMFNQLKKHFK